MAMAGGVSIRLPLKGGYLYSEGGIHSPDGHCRAFDANAKGTVSGSGVGIVVLKRLEDALNDNDTIDAIIKGSAINNDGTVKVSYSAPSIEGQAKANASAQIMAEVEPENITYIEAHGTGTPLGEPIEVAALTQVFAAKTEDKNFCALGAVKTNIGHLDAAAGVAGLIKTILALKHQLIPPSLNFEQPNPQIDFENSPFYVNTKPSVWSKDNNTPRCSGVSSFGMGGTNAHVIVEEAPPLQVNKGAGEQGRKYNLLVLSAKTESAIETATNNLVEYLKQHPEINLADVAYTLQVGRRPFNYRRILVCENDRDAIEAFSNKDTSRVTTGFYSVRDREIVFMFPGQGTQYADMGKELYQSEPVLKTRSIAVRNCSNLY
ncbi:Phthiocerol synthesis polyketide synthase type I PpsE (fragment) [Hyella patelloides LEGE 07179]|uniref:Phthiocerol synthesis polyketide synthase type I PpsE n=1 Tax=Hyella patelloides LEGE 07179 TaxID=945734 RepID=A0A563VPK6_9CYAN